MTRTSFSILLKLMITQGGYKVKWAHGKRPLLPEKMLQIGLRYLASKDGFLQLSDRFNVAISTVAIVRKRTLNALINLLPVLIKWPSGNDREVIVRDFHQICGFPSKKTPSTFIFIKYWCCLFIRSNKWTYIYRVCTFLLYHRILQFIFVLLLPNFLIHTWVWWRRLPQGIIDLC